MNLHSLANQLYERIKSRSPLALASLSLISVIIVYVFWWVLSANYRNIENTDYARDYRPVAKNIVAGKGMMTAGEQLAIFYPPGYPVILSGLFIDC